MGQRNYAVFGFDANRLLGDARGRTGFGLLSIGALASFSTGTLIWFFGFLALTSIALATIGTRKKSKPSAQPVTDQRALQTKTECGAGACLVVQVSNYDALKKRFGAVMMAEHHKQAKKCLSSEIRAGDNIADLGGGRFDIWLVSATIASPADCKRMARRLQARLEEPVSIGDSTLFATCAVGICHRDYVTDQSPAMLAKAARQALAEALGDNPSGISAYSNGLAKKIGRRRVLRKGLSDALSNGEIRAWFQPQVCADTGKLSGVEALARWKHPKYGLLLPPQFLPTIHETGQGAMLTNTMLRESCSALRAWDNFGIPVPRVGINFGIEDLMAPDIADRILWELDRHDLAADRLCIEILENVIVDGASTRIRNTISRLDEIGCKFDLDDFGTGYASIGTIRKLPINRLKIDRSFVCAVDRNPEQKRMISAILTMAERLGLDTVAEGVESAGEHATLAQLGCTHLQGFGIAHPMPAADISGWLRNHGKAIPAPMRISNRSN